MDFLLLPEELFINFDILYILEKPIMDINISHLLLPEQPITNFDHLQADRIRNRKSSQLISQYSWWTIEYVCGDIKMLSILWEMLEENWGALNGLRSKLHKC